MLKFVIFIFFMSMLFCRSFLSYLLLLELVVITLVFSMWGSSIYYSMGLSLLVVGVSGASVGLALLIFLTE